jgi:hypothetical protein
MKRFIFRTVFFLSPFILLEILSLLFYSKEQGDLIRMGYIRKDDPYREQFKAEISRPRFFHSFADVDTTKKNHYSVITIGDSFSEQDNFGYKNYLAESDAVTVLHVDKPRGSSNPIETLYALLNGDLLQHVDVSYIVLQSVEREFVARGQKIDKKKKISIRALQKAAANKKPNDYSISFPPPELWKFPLYNVLYHYNDHAYYSEVYRVKLDEQLFSGRRPDELLFYKVDLDHTPLNSDRKAIENLNSELNELSAMLEARKIKLIVLPGPDKYDMYYDHIVNKAMYPKPAFFKIFGEMKKDYLYIDSRMILGNLLPTGKDVYFYDDTHWSPQSAKIIAGEISKIIRRGK